MNCNVVIFVVCLQVFIHFGSCNIHRGISGNSKNPLLNRYKFSDKLIDDLEEEELGYIDRIIHKASVVWLYAIPAAILVGSTGIFPLLIFYNCPNGEKLNESISPDNLKLLLSFSVGGLFGDVFLHLLPEAWMYLDPTDHFAPIRIGLWILAGLICFLVIEKIFSIHDELSEDKKDKENETETNGDCAYSNGSLLNKESNGVTKRKTLESEDSSKEVYNDKTEKETSSVQGKLIIGYLNLLANCIDNFTHGLAVGGSFIVSVPIGVCTTFAILLHEIPHEIGDFAILLKAGFSKWEAAKGQIITASGALFGCLFGLIADSAGDSSSWVLPFTAGGFLYIACVTIIPDLLEEKNLIQSIKQVIFLFAGIGIMASVSLIH